MRAKLHVKTRSTVAHAGRPILELPHIGARNLRQRALVKLFSGGHCGKLLVRVAPSA